MHLQALLFHSTLLLLGLLFRLVRWGHSAESRASGFPSAARLPAHPAMSLQCSGCPPPARPAVSLRCSLDSQRCVLGVGLGQELGQVRAAGSASSISPCARQRRAQSRLDSGRGPGLQGAGAGRSCGSAAGLPFWPHRLPHVACDSRPTSPRWRCPSPHDCTTHSSAPRAASSAPSWRSVAGSTSTSPWRARAATPWSSGAHPQTWRRPGSSCCTWQRRR